MRRQYPAISAAGRKIELHEVVAAQLQPFGHSARRQASCYKTICIGDGK